MLTSLESSRADIANVLPLSIVSTRFQCIWLGEFDRGDPGERHNHGNLLSMRWILLKDTDSGTAGRRKHV